jgi:hypothetical protein
MSFPKVKLVLACGVTAIAVSACGTIAKPLAGTPGVTTAPGIHGKIDDARTRQTNHVACLKSHHLPVVLKGATNLQIGAAPGGPFVHFAPTPGAAQADQISGQAKYEGAEVIGAALLYPNQGSSKELETVEDCIAQGVGG